MTYLLKSTSLFRCLPNSSYVQLAGKPIQLVISTRHAWSGDGQWQLKRKLPTESSDMHPSRPVKRKRQDEEMLAQDAINAANKGIGMARKGASVKNAPRSAMDIPIPRYLIFFSRPTRIGSSGIKVGFPTSRKFPCYHHLSVSELLLDVLSAFDERRRAFSKSMPINPFGQPAGPKNTSISADELDLEQHGRHLLKHIFPRQYGIRSVFTVYRVREAPTWKMKEISIAVGDEGLANQLVLSFSRHSTKANVQPRVA